MYVEGWDLGFLKALVMGDELAPPPGPIKYFTLKIRFFRQKMDV